MKWLILLVLLGVVAKANGFTRDNSLLARVTVYWAHGGRGADRYTRQHKSATGLRLRQGHCAVDPKKIPYGSRVVLPDGSALSAVDTGSAVRNRKAARRSGRTSPAPRRPMHRLLARPEPSLEIRSAASAADIVGLTQRSTSTGYDLV